MSEAVAANPVLAQAISISGFADAFSAQAYIRPRLYCSDGFSFGVVAGTHASSTPRAVNARKYSHVQVVQLSEVHEPLLQYAEDPATPCDSTYAFVPVKEVEAVIESHGGLDWATTLECAHANALPLLKRLQSA
jgi:hypothetical protein